MIENNAAGFPTSRLRSQVPPQPTYGSIDRIGRLALPGFESRPAAVLLCFDRVIGDGSSSMRSLMRSLIGMLVVIVAACAGQPTANPVAGAPGPPRVEASKVADMQRAGYKIKNRNGQKLYCSKDLETGSHLQTTTACLTEEQWMRVNQKSQSTIDAITTQTLSIPPNPGH